MPSAYLAKHLQALARAGVLETVKGPRGGYRLARPPAEITVLDVVEAIDGDEPAFRCTEIRRRGPSAVPAAGVPDARAASTAPSPAPTTRGAPSSAATTIADLVIGVVQEAPRAAVEKGARWLGEAVR